MGAHRRAGDPHPLAASLDEHVGGVAEIGRDEDALGGLAADRAKPADGIGNVGLREGAHHCATEALEHPFERPEMRVVAHAAVADHDIGIARNHRRDQLGDVRAFILAVGIGVDDDVRPVAKREVDPALECGGEPAIAAVAHYVVHAVLARDIRSAVGTAIVDHQDFDDIHALDRARQGRQRVRQVIRLIEARNLDDELRHWCPSRLPTSYLPPLKTP